MLLSTREITGYSLAAADGKIGEVTSLLFDDRDWNVRYLAARRMRWLGREVILSPQAFADPDWGTRTIPVRLTKDQIKSSPSISLDAPVSVRQLNRLHRHYCWGTWWGTPAEMGPPPAPAPAPSTAVMEEEDDGDPHLRSSRAVVGTDIEARDGDIGYLEDLIVDTAAWKIRYLIVNTRRWLPGKEVLVLPEHVTDIDWSGGKVVVDLSREQVRESAEFDPEQPINREFEVRLLDFYGRPHYWR